MNRFHVLYLQNHANMIKFMKSNLQQLTAELFGSLKNQFYDLNI